MNVSRRVAIAAAAALAILVATPVGGPAQASQVRVGHSAPHGAKDAAEKALRQELKASNARYRVAERELVFLFNDDPNVKVAQSAFEASVDSATSTWRNSAQDGPATETAKNAILHAEATYSDTTLTEAAAREAAIETARATWVADSLAAYAAHDNAALLPVEAAARIAYRASSNQAWSDFAEVEQFCLVFDDISNFINWQEACPLLAAATTNRSQALAAAWGVYVGSGGSSTRAIPGANLTPPKPSAARHAAVAPASASVASHAATRAPRDEAKKALRVALKAADAGYSRSYIDLFNAFWGATSGPDAIFDAAIESATDAWENSGRGGAALEAMKVAVLIAELAYSDATLPEASTRETLIDAAKALWMQDSLAAYATHDWVAYSPNVAAARVTYRASSNEAWSDHDKVRQFCQVAYEPSSGYGMQAQKDCALLIFAVTNRDQALATARQAYHNTLGAWPGKIEGGRLWYPTVVTGY